MKLTLALLLFLVCGCSTISTKKPISTHKAKAKPTKSAIQDPGQVVCTFTDNATYRAKNKPKKKPAVVQCPLIENPNNGIFECGHTLLFGTPNLKIEFQLEPNPTDLNVVQAKLYNNNLIAATKEIKSNAKGQFNESQSVTLEDQTELVAYEISCVSSAELLAD